MFKKMFEAFKESRNNSRGESYSTIRKWQFIEENVEIGNNQWGYFTGTCGQTAHYLTQFIIENKLDPNRKLKSGAPVIHYFRRWNSVYIIGCCNSAIRRLKDYGAVEDINSLPDNIDDAGKKLMAYKDPYEAELLNKTVPL